MALPPAFFQLSVEALKAILCIVALTTRKGLPGHESTVGAVVDPLGGELVGTCLEISQGIVGGRNSLLKLPYFFVHLF